MTNKNELKKKFKKPLVYKVDTYKQYSITEYCPWSDIVSSSAFTEDEIKDLFKDALIQNKDGSIGITFEFTSPLTDNSESFEVDKVDRLSDALSVLNSRWTLHFDTSRREVKSFYKNESENMLPFDKKIENLREREARSYKLFEIKNYLTLNYLLKTNNKGDEITESPIEDFYVGVKNFISLLQNADFSLRVLRGDELLSYLHYTITLKEQEIHSDIERGTFGLDELLTTELLDYTKHPFLLGDKYIAVLSVNGIKQNHSYPNNLSVLFSLQIPFRLVNRFKCYSVEESEKIITQKREVYNSKIIDLRKMVFSSLEEERNIDEDIRQVENKRQCEEALSVLTGGGMSYALYTGVLIIEAESEEEIKKRTRLVQDMLQSIKIVVKDEKLNGFPAFLSSLPHDTKNNPRQFLISTYNIACYCNLVSLYQGKKENEFLKKLTGVGTPHLYGYLFDNSPFFLNLNGGIDDVGHTLIVGNTGGGKSFLLSLLISRWSKYKNSRCFIFDRGYSAYNLVKNNGGKIIIPLSDNVVFNPLKNCKKKQTTAIQFLECILKVNNVSLKSEEMKDINFCLDNLAEYHTNLSLFLQLLKGKNHNHPLAYLLEKYTHGYLGDLFNNTEDLFLDNKDNNRLTLIELDKIINLGKDVVSPTLIYMFDRLVELFSDKRPTLLVLDECWTFLMNEVFRDYLVMFLKTMRKNNVFVVMSTQNIKDIQIDPIAESTILSSVHTRIFCADDRATSDDITIESYKKLGLSDFQMEILSSAQRKKHYYIMSSEGDALVDFRAESLKDVFTSNIKENLEITL